MPVLDFPIPKAAWAHEVGERDGGPLKPAEQPAVDLRADAGPWWPAVQKIADFQHLGDDWDGFGAKVPSRELLETAIGLAYVFNQKGVDPAHRVVPGVDGTVIFEWQDPGGGYTEVEVVRPLYAEGMMIEPGKAPVHWTIPTE
jgi:hypothetical protein